MVKGQLLSTIMWQEGVGPIRMAYAAGIPYQDLWAKICGAQRFTSREVDAVCRVLRITPDLRREIFGEVQHE